MQFAQWIPQIQPKSCLSSGVRLASFLSTSKRSNTAIVSSAERRTIPHIEPPGDRDRSHEAGVIYFIKAPKTKYGEHPKYYIEDPDGRLCFSSNFLPSMYLIRPKTKGQRD